MRFWPAVPSSEALTGSSGRSIISVMRTPYSSVTLIPIASTGNDPWSRGAATVSQAGRHRPRDCARGRNVPGSISRMDRSCTMARHRTWGNHGLSRTVPERRPGHGPGTFDRKPVSALLGADGQASDEVPLQRQVDDERGQGDVHRSSRDQVVIREKLTAKVCQRGGNRPVRTLLLEDHGPEEVVVDPRKLQRGQRRECRERERHDDLPILLPDTRAVDAGG